MKTICSIFFVNFDKKINNLFNCNIRDYFQSQNGNVALVFALLFTPILVAVGGGIDYANASRVRSNLQEIIDASVLAGAVSLSDPNEAETKANNFYDSHEKLVQATANFNIVGGDIYGTASGSMPTSFLGIIGINSIAINVEASATDVSTF
ncbi:MAG: Tad domain-containing protein [Rhizobiales bacterium]|nr:Tad domain-containing protein [Hyphomicrobiales bacterium]